MCIKEDSHMVNFILKDEIFGGWIALIREGFSDCFIKSRSLPFVTFSSWFWCGCECGFDVGNDVVLLYLKESCVLPLVVVCVDSDK